ncbi:MAG: hypothetical protein ACMXYG_04525 [Candidatus Woesearchaeota archaeon]
MNHRTFGQWVREKTIELAAAGILGYGIGMYHSNQRNSDAINLQQTMQSSSNYAIMYTISNQNAFPHLVYTGAAFPIDANDINTSIDVLLKQIKVNNNE